MAIEVTWHNDEKSIILEKYPKKWTWDDFNGLRDSIIPMMNEVPHLVYVIADFGDNPNIPGGNALNHARNLISVFPENWGLLIMVSRSNLISSLFKMFNLLFPAKWSRKIHLVKTYDEAYKLIAKHQR